MLVSAVTLSSSAESKCLACSDRSAYKEMTKRTIKEEILRRLGFSSAPNVTGEYYSKIPFIQKQIREVSFAFSALSKPHGCKELGTIRKGLDFVIGCDDTVCESINLSIKKLEIAKVEFLLLVVGWWYCEYRVEHF